MIHRMNELSARPTTWGSVWSAFFLGCALAHVIHINLG